MQAFKIAFVAVFALCAIQAQGAEIPEYRNATHVNLRLFVVNGAAIAKNLFTAVNSGLDKSKPNVDLILNELAPEAKALARKKIDEVRAIIYDEEKRIDHIFKTLDKALDNLKPIKPCSDKYSAEAKKLATKTEKDIVKLVNTMETKYKKELDNIKVGVNKTLTKLRTLFDTEVDAVVKCLKPGRKDAKDCMDKELDKIVKGVMEVAVDVFMLITTAQDTLSPMLNDIIDGGLKIFKEVVDNGKPIVDKLADCVSKMK